MISKMIIRLIIIIKIINKRIIIKRMNITNKKF